MIPKLSFPIEKLRLTPLFLDTTELKKMQDCSSAKRPLSKVAEAYHNLYFPPPSDDRPYIFASMVLSLDGKMAFPDNPQGPVVASANCIDPEGSLVDFWILNVLRAHADAIIVGAKTLNAEPDVICSCLDPDLVAEREEALGKSNPLPLNIIVSLDGTDIPLNHAIFSNRDIQTIIATSHTGGQYLHEQYGENTLLIGPFFSFKDVEEKEMSQQRNAGLSSGKKVIVMTGENTPDARVLLYALRKIGIEHLLIESPTYIWLLMNEQMLDEFFVNYSSLYIGGPLTPGYASGFSFRNHPHARFLAVAMHNNSFIFTRQKLVYGLSK